MPRAPGAARRAGRSPVHVEGRSRGLTVVTPIRPFGIWANRFFFGLAWLYPPLMGFRPLRSIYATRWSLLTRFPQNGAPQRRERPQHPLLVWETDFSGAPEPYIELFVDRIPTQINQTWRTSYGFPGTRSVTELRRYIQQLALPVAYRYSAYPDASVRMVLSALEVAREHPFLAEAARTADPEEFARAYRGFLRRRQGDL